MVVLALRPLAPPSVNCFWVVQRYYIELDLWFWWQKCSVSSLLYQQLIDECIFSVVYILMVKVNFSLFGRRYFVVLKYRIYFSHLFISPLWLLSTLFFFLPASSLAAVPCWVESNLNYASQGPISLLPAVGISGLLISYQAVIGLRSPRPSDIPQIYDTPDRLRGGWGGGGDDWWRGRFLPPANILLNKMSSWPQRCQLSLRDFQHYSNQFNRLKKKKREKERNKLAANVRSGRT